jgi:hypothetical protein
MANVRSEGLVLEITIKEMLTPEELKVEILTLTVVEELVVAVRSTNCQFSVKMM